MGHQSKPFSRHLTFRGVYSSPSDTAKSTRYTKEGAENCSLVYKYNIVIPLSDFEMSPTGATWRTVLKLHDVY